MNSNHYCPHTPEEIQEMLAAIGVDSIDGLFAPIPAELRCTTFNLPQGMSEFETYSRMQKLAADNSQNLSLFIGGGFYDHIIPAAVDHLAGRAEFYTAYTPYQPECSQGTLQALFEYQTAICRITGMDVSNASLYDGATALAEAALMAMRSTNRNKVLVDSCVSPIARQVLATYLSHHDAEIIEIPHSSCSIDRAAVEKELDENTAALLIQYPNAFGTVDDFSGLSDKLHAAGALLVSSVYPLALGILKSPAEIGADIAVGDGQSLGNPLSFGGPSFGFIASTKAHIRNIPGRIVGETLDKNGKRGFVLTLQAREQHIKRHKATSNICSNQSLCALRGLIFLSAIGKQGLVDLSSLNYNKAEYAKAALAAVSGISLVNTSPTFNEFTVALTKPADDVVAALLDKGIAAGIPMGNLYKGADNLMVVTVTEKRTKREIDCLAKELEVILCN